MAGNQIVDPNGPFRIYEVKEVDGERVRLVSEDGSGWIEASKIVLFDQAVDYYTKELVIDPKNAKAYSHRGVIWVYGNNQEKALADFTETIRLGPEEAQHYYNRAILLGTRLDFDKAVADYTEAIRLNPKWVEPYHRRGDAWHEKGMYDKAIADLTNAIPLGARDSHVNGTRGNAWLKKKEYDKAIADLSEATKLDPKNAVTVFPITITSPVQHQARACWRSARRSSTSSIPTLSRTRPSSTPRAVRISAGMLACVIVAG
jgi:tetratricopeptide (TPR) repeat protein